MSKFRTKLLIYPQFQLALIFSNTIVICLICVLLQISSAKFIRHLKEFAIQSQIPSNHIYFETLRVISENINKNLIFTFIIGFSLSNVITLILSHRLAGPLIRLKGYFKTIADGEELKSELKFRDGDFFSDLPPIVNQAVLKLQNQTSKEIPKA